MNSLHLTIGSKDEVNMVFTRKQRLINIYAKVRG